MTHNLGPTDLKRLHRDWRRRGAPPLAMALDDVQGPFNVGAIVRTAAAERLDHLWLAGSTPPPTSSKVQRTAMGCDRLIPWNHTADIAEALTSAETRELRIVGVELAQGAQPIFDIDLTGPVCLVVGHEDRGLSATALARCHQLGFIPQMGRVGSLNVAQAASIAIYEARRQTWAEPSSEM
jgi:tRNA (guanosine-2'-O-)-methyltransferase